MPIAIVCDYCDANQVGIYQATGVSRESERVQAITLNVLDELRNTGEALSRQDQDLYALVLKAARECSEAGWDGGDALPVARVAINEAHALIKAFPSDIPKPEVTVEPTGEICFEWYRDKWNLVTFSVGGGGTVVYSAMYGINDRSYGRKPLRVRLQTELKLMIDKLGV